MKSTQTATSGLITLGIVAIIFQSISYFLYDNRDVGFLVGFACGLALWQINYRNCYGKWFDY